MLTDDSSSTSKAMYEISRKSCDGGVFKVLLAIKDTINNLMLDFINEVVCL